MREWKKKHSVLHGWNQCWPAGSAWQCLAVVVKQRGALFMRMLAVERDFGKSCCFSSHSQCSRAEESPSPSPDTRRSRVRSPSGAAKSSTSLVYLPRLSTTSCSADRKPRRSSTSHEGQEYSRSLCVIYADCVMESLFANDSNLVAEEEICNLPFRRDLYWHLASLWPLLCPSFFFYIQIPATSWSVYIPLCPT